MVVATVAIFLPAFLLVAASGPFVSRLRESRLVAVDPRRRGGSLALMAGRHLAIGPRAVTDAVTAVLAIGSAFLLLRFRLNSTWLIVGGAGVGTILGIVQAP